MKSITLLSDTIRKQHKEIYHLKQELNENTELTRKNSEIFLSIGDATIQGC